MCAVVGVKRTSYYKWRIKGEKAQEDGRSANADTLGEQVEAVFWQHSRRYGTRRIVAELKAAGIKAGRTRVRRLLEERNLRAIQPKSFVPKTTNSKHTLGYSPNLLLEVRLPPSAVNKVIVGDITYLPMLSGGWCYLATFTDLFSRRIVGWAVRETMSEELVLEAYRMLRQRRRPTRWTIIHSDRGGQSAGRQFRNLLLADKAAINESSSGELRQCVCRKRILALQSGIAGGRSVSRRGRSKAGNVQLHRRLLQSHSSSFEFRLP